MTKAFSVPVLPALLGALLFLAVAATDSLLSPVTPEIHVSSAGVDSDSCGQEETSPCTFQAALAASPPYSTLRLKEGRYYGQYRITKPLSITAEDGVVFDGQNENQPMWFDNVPAKLDHITFVNGFGAGAGCVLNTMASDHPDDGSSIVNCHFFNCTGVEIDDLPSVGGGLLVYHAYSSGRTQELQRLKFSNNYARGGDVASGGILVQYGNHVKHHPNPRGTAPASLTSKAMYVQLVPNEHNGGRFRESSAQETSVCSKYVLTQGPQKHGDIFYRFGNATVGGRELYSTVHQFPTEKGDKSFWLAHCEVRALTQKLHRGLWAIIIVDGPLSTVENLNPCRADLIMSTQDFPCPDPDSCSHWNRKGVPVMEPVRFQCQDFADACPVVQVHGAPAAQEGRAGVYERSEVTRKGRPTFLRRDESARVLQHMWYCEHGEEWIIGDDNPMLVPPGGACRRGLASGPTNELHPLSVPSWRYFDREWKATPPKNPLTLKCAPQGREICDAVQIISADHLEGVPLGPFLLTNVTWRARPTFYALATRHWLWYCKTFSEWIVTTVDPATLDPADDEKCLRDFSSHWTLALSPILQSKWVHLRKLEWVTAAGGTKVRCVSDCPSFVFDVDGLKPPSGLGIYETIGMYRGSRVFRQTTAPFLYMWREAHFWLVMPQFQPGERIAALLSAALLMGMAPSIAGECGGTTNKQCNRTASHPFFAREWKLHNETTGEVHSISHPLISCLTHARCGTVEATNAPAHLRQIAGTYVRQGYSKGGRAVYLKPRPASCARAGDFCTDIELFYCTLYSKWVFGAAEENTEEKIRQRKACFSWATSRSTAAFTPVEAPAFDLAFNRNASPQGQWEVLDQGLRVLCAASPDAAPSPPSPLVSVTNCSFAGNTALGGANASAGGGAALHIGSATVGDAHVGIFRKVNVEQNEATSVTASPSASVGGVAIMSYLSFAPTQHLHNLAISENTGAVGGLLLNHIHGHGHRVTVSRNRATHSGGGFTIGGWSNFSVTRFSCVRNQAGMHGGCIFADPRSSLHFTKSDFAENSAAAGEGSMLHGGAATILESKLSGLTSKGITTTYLSLTNSEILCGRARAVTYLHGFGCVDEDFPSVSLARPLNEGDAGASKSIFKRLTSGLFSTVLRVVVAVASLAYLAFYFVGWWGGTPSAPRRMPKR